MSLQGPALASRVRRRLSSVAHLRRPCKAAAVLAIVATASLPNAGAAACHKYSIWKYPFPQRCNVYPQQIFAAIPPERPANVDEQIAIPLPPLDFEV